MWHISQIFYLLFFLVMNFQQWPEILGMLLSKRQMGPRAIYKVEQKEELLPR